MPLQIRLLGFHMMGSITWPWTSIRTWIVSNEANLVCKLLNGKTNGKMVPINLGVLHFLYKLWCRLITNVKLRSHSSGKIIAFNTKLRAVHIGTATAICDSPRIRWNPFGKKVIAPRAIQCRWPYSIFVNAGKSLEVGCVAPPQYLSNWL